MSEKLPLDPGYVDLSNLGEHYDRHGKEKVDIRQLVYACTEPGVEAPDYDIEVIAGLQYAGMPDTGMVVDIGCSYPRFLELLQMTGHVGELIGIEPNTDQFNGLPYWQPKQESTMNRATRDRLHMFYQRMWGNGKTLPGIDLYEAAANEMPLEDATADAETAIFSASHWDQERLLEALDEVIRVGKLGFVFAATLSNHDNKYIIHEDQIKMARFCSDVVGKEVTPPPPLHAGLTSERAEKIFPLKFQNVYKKLFEYTIWIDSPARKEIMFNAHRTQFDQYKTPDGQTVQTSITESGLQLVVGEAIDAKLRQGQAYTDRSIRTVFLNSQDPKRIMPGYEVVQGQAA